jgi:hypothetical protein
MAQPIEKLEPVETVRGQAKVVPLTAGSCISPQETQFQPTSRIESLEDQISRALAHAMQSLRPKLNQARVVTSEACIYAIHESRSIARLARKRAAEIKEEHPLEVLYGITAGAFVLGVAIRIWRSSHHEPRS